MTMRLVQLGDGQATRVAWVQEPHLRFLDTVGSVLELAQRGLAESRNLSELAASLATAETLLYDEVYRGEGRWKLLAPIHVPGAPERLLVSGTGLTHLGSAKERQKMHLKTAADANKPVTDSMRMFELGLAGGRPAEGEIGAAPEWFYKGNGTVLQAPLAPLTVPSHAEDGGEEAELAGVYLIGADGQPVRIGVAAGNEFSDHKFEKRNYLNLAGSKLRTCSLGPELVIGASLQDVHGTVSIERAGTTIWSKAIESGEDNMAHSLRNLEHHHFKFDQHRRPGDVHVHFYGAHSLSFGEGLQLQNGDWMVVSFEGFGRPLRNPVALAPAADARPIHVDVMG